MLKTTDLNWKKSLCLSLLALLCFLGQSGITLALSPEKPEDISVAVIEVCEPEMVYAWDKEQKSIAWSEIDQVVILDTNKHTTNVLQLPLYPNLVRIIIDLGFNPDGTKIFTISLIDEPQIDSTVMEMHIFSLDGKIIARNVFSNLAEADWITENKINLTIYSDMSWEHGEIQCWDLQTGQVTASEIEII